MRLLNRPALLATLLLLQITATLPAVNTAQGRGVESSYSARQKPSEAAAQRLARTEAARARLQQRRENIRQRVQQSSRPSSSPLAAWSRFQVAQLKVKSVQELNALSKEFLGSGAVKHELFNARLNSFREKLADLEVQASFLEPRLNAFTSIEQIRSSTRQNLEEIKSQVASFTKNRNRLYDEFAVLANVKPLIQQAEQLQSAVAALDQRQQKNQAEKDLPQYQIIKSKFEEQRALSSALKQTVKDIADKLNKSSFLNQVYPNSPKQQELVKELKEAQRLQKTLEISLRETALLAPCAQVISSFERNFTWLGEVFARYPNQEKNAELAEVYLGHVKATKEFFGTSGNTWLISAQLKEFQIVTESLNSLALGLLKQGSH